MKNIYIKYKQGYIEIRTFDDSKVSSVDFAKQFNATVSSKEEYDAYIAQLEAERLAEQELRKTTTYSIPLPVTVEALGVKDADGNPVFNQLISDLLTQAVNNGAVVRPNPSNGTTEVDIYDSVIALLPAEIVAGIAPFKK